jgi:hypothetical protein
LAGPNFFCYGLLPDLAVVAGAPGEKGRNK